MTPGLSNVFIVPKPFFLPGLLTKKSGFYHSRMDTGKGFE